MPGNEIEATGENVIEALDKVINQCCRFDTYERKNNAQNGNAKIVLG